MEKHDKPRMILAVCTMLFLLIFGICNMLLPKEATGQLLKKEITFSEYTQKVHSVYVSNALKAKTTFLNLNGLFARASGRRVYNNTVLLNNGMLTQMGASVDINAAAEGFDGLSAFVEEMGGKFLYIQAPYKVDNGKTLLPEGVDNYCNDNAQKLLDELDRRGIDTIDLLPLLSETPEQIEQYFFSTDHHWNCTGAFVAFQEIVGHLAEADPGRGIDQTYTQWEQWESTTLEDQFLGSLGKRVGALYAGVDDLTYYIPKFETEISCAVPKYRDLFKGDFSEANMRETYLGEKNWFGLNNYCAYIGGDYPLVQHRNADAPSDLKLLILKDSFTLPVQSYLSTIFQEIDVIDPRHYKEYTVAEYIAWTRPDIVMMLINPSSISNPVYYQCGFDTFTASEEYTPWIEEDTVKLEPKDTAWNYVSFPLEYGKEYILSCEDVEVTNGMTDGVITALYDETGKNLLSINVFDIEYCREQGEFQWHFQTPKEGSNQLKLLFYAGVRGHNANVGTIYRNVKVLVAEDR